MAQTAEEQVQEANNRYEMAKTGVTRAGNEARASLADLRVLQKAHPAIFEKLAIVVPAKRKGPGKKAEGDAAG